MSHVAMSALLATFVGLQGAACMAPEDLENQYAGAEDEAADTASAPASPIGYQCGVEVSGTGCYDGQTNIVLPSQRGQVRCPATKVRFVMQEVNGTTINLRASFLSAVNNRWTGGRMADSSNNGWTQPVTLTRDGCRSGVSLHGAAGTECEFVSGDWFPLAIPQNSPDNRRPVTAGMRARVRVFSTDWNDSNSNNRKPHYEVDLPGLSIIKGTNTIERYENSPVYYNHPAVLGHFTSDGTAAHRDQYCNP